MPRTGRVDDQVVARRGVVAGELNLASAGERQLGAAAREHVLALVAAAAAEAVGLRLPEVVAPADREEVVAEEEGSFGAGGGAGDAIAAEAVGAAAGNPAYALAVPADLGRRFRVPLAHDLAGRLAEELHMAALRHRVGRPATPGEEEARRGREVERLGLGGVAHAHGEARGGVVAPAVDQRQPSRARGRPGPRRSRTDSCASPPRRTRRGRRERRSAPRSRAANRAPRTCARAAASSQRTTRRASRGRWPSAPPAPRGPWRRRRPRGRAVAAWGRATPTDPAATSDTRTCLHCKGEGLSCSTPPGLADGLALKRLRYGCGTQPIRPKQLGSPVPPQGGFGRLYEARERLAALLLLKAARKPVTTASSNCVPAPASSSARAAFSPRAGR